MVGMDAKLTIIILAEAEPTLQLNGNLSCYHRVLLTFKKAETVYNPVYVEH